MNEWSRKLVFNIKTVINWPVCVKDCDDQRQVATPSPRQRGSQLLSCMARFSTRRLFNRAILAVKATFPTALCDDYLFVYFASCLCILFVYFICGSRWQSVYFVGGLADCLFVYFTWVWTACFVLLVLAMFSDPPRATRDCGLLTPAVTGDRTGIWLINK